MNEILPIHVAIIMDGNRRWAKKHKVNPIEGHRKGVDTLIKIVEEAVRIGIKYLTVYALSTENLKNRTKSEVLALLKLIEEGFTKHLPRLKKEGARLNCIGDVKTLPISTQMIINRAIDELKGGKNVVITVAINYGGRDEILRAANNLTVEKRPFSESQFEDQLYTAGMPDPNIVIRTGGHKRLSNFLLWQSSYSELYFTDVLWPDFDAKELGRAIKSLKTGVRNWGR
ncbi:MAG: di-trans,poly-cis-decaprenylcistransferase [Candidatus Woykebacteria bacterium RIFCSPHIGHO2_01_FULL_39_12]|uniref:Isoprenyl transferase n=2 Tax=Candidatus Woykeibacteriota TaxID=1817899 RepID=A0A1G1WEM1_9BACT|nr:MAG: di-trans,poly-cis-decaprenylcistransferase [Candidatus Woykebacteria bacterium RBG_16_39_9b]OGY26883.1 MAG: di-trans,poly-cis-decaprenylcistransferase [Candidatus Woykebacteria bacterium RIFCSPHIGHO2_01_FULL_39_12]